MISLRASLSLFVAAALITAPAFATRTHRSTTGAHGRGSQKLAKSHKQAKSHKLHGHQAIDANRVTQIQQALIREHYFNGEANGEWDAPTQAAMQKYQSAQGWQTRLMPDSRALKKLGLGPDYSGAINAKDSSFAAPPSANTIPPEQASGFAAAARINQ